MFCASVSVSVVQLCNRLSLVAAVGGVEKWEALLAFYFAMSPLSSFFREPRRTKTLNFTVA